MKDKESIKRIVKERYSRIALGGGSTCCGTFSCCADNKSEDISRGLGYSREDLKATPAESNLGLGCGNPVALASLKAGETVLDLGSGPGLDCFIASQKVGEKGKIIGVDMTPEMVKKAQDNAKNGGFRNVEFRLGEIENLPVSDNSVDVVISNCVINLSPEKERVFCEAFRVLKPGGRLIVSDIVLLKDLPQPVMESVEAYVGCLSGAIKKNAYLRCIRKAGFIGVKIIDEKPFPLDLIISEPEVQTFLESTEIEKLDKSVESIRVIGYKPARLSPTN